MEKTINSSTAICNKMEINIKLKNWIENTLKKLPFVSWDRYIEDKDKKNNLIEVYGWIERDNNYKDFVLLEFDLNKKQVYFIATSSDRYSKEIAEILNSPHPGCIRVEDNFDVLNSIKIKFK